ncbi:DNA-binding PadR family transcriptional regulator [Stackebrandtia endophytica]|uniref:DNA-binding PadR family transcriptional regulator n=1 Tax=Stackebrandtia endophytica TaxID=1496996 RepID=A0A543B0A2_9ACTN|nr:helix-turn-helix transcriptional regulator [Stackebrandtia endophytica]TQL78258.1 DNA-binding PadR family transcriptional regulator [Stackebrandtia endophytica]
MEAQSLEGHVTELRRGSVVVACLTLLVKPTYGYVLAHRLNDAGFLVEQNTLYPLLRRLEKQGLLVSEWNTDESRPRKFYRTTPEGDHAAAALRGELDRMRAGLAALKKDNDDEPDR